jgi:hypothetical protein
MDTVNEDSAPRRRPDHQPARGTGPVSPEDIRAAAEVHAELGPDYSDAVVASFMDKVDREIAARVEARVAGAPRAPLAPRDRRRGPWTGITIGVAAAGIPLIALTQLHPELVRHMVSTVRGPGGAVSRVIVQGGTVRGPAPVNAGWLLLWLLVVAVCAAGAIRARRRTAGRA